MTLIGINDNAILYEFNPTILSLLPIPMEKLTIIRRVRFIYEYLCGGYKVYYLQVDRKYIGYCVVTPGGRRLKCTSKNDIVIGPYYIMPEFRGNGYAKTLIMMTLSFCTYRFNHVYCWISKTNIPSIKTVESCGMNPNGLRLNVVGKLRRLVFDEHGGFAVYKK